MVYVSGLLRIKQTLMYRIIIVITTTTFSQLHLLLILFLLLILVLETIEIDHSDQLVLKDIVIRAPEASQPRLFSWPMPVKYACG